MPPAGRRWKPKAREWLDAKRLRRRYEGKHGNDAVRFLERVGASLRKDPRFVTEPDLWACLPLTGKSDKSRLWGYTILASFLSWNDNWIVQSSGIRSNFRNRATRTPTATVEEWETAMGRAVGQERVVLALLWPRRTIEVRRSLVGDVDLEHGTIDVRGKGGHGEVTDYRMPLSNTALRELRWYLPFRAQWSAGVDSDSGHLLCRREGNRLVGVSTQYVRRCVVQACGRVGLKIPNHAFRRGALTYLADREASLVDIKAMAGHRSVATTESYIHSLQQQRRLPSVARMLDPPAREAV